MLNGKTGLCYWISKAVVYWARSKSWIESENVCDWGNFLIREFSMENILPDFYGTRLYTLASIIYENKLCNHGSSANLLVGWACTLASEGTTLSPPIPILLHSNQVLLLLVPSCPGAAYVSWMGSEESAEHTIRFRQSVESQLLLWNSSQAQTRYSHFHLHRGYTDPFFAGIKLFVHYDIWGIFGFHLPLLFIICDLAAVVHGYHSGTKAWL